MQPIIAIVDDNPIIAEDIKTILESNDYHNIQTYYTGQKIVDKMKGDGIKPNLIIMDINLGKNKMDGFQAARLVREISREVEIIYISGEDDKIQLLGKSLGPHIFLVKSLLNDKALLGAIDMAFHRLSQRILSLQKPFIVKDAVYVSDGGVYRRISIEEISVIKGDGSSVIIITKNGKPISYSVRIGDFMRRWNNAVQKGLVDNCIQRINNSYAVNMLNVLTFGKTVTMLGYKGEIGVKPAFCPNIMDYFIVFNTIPNSD